MAPSSGPGFGQDDTDWEAFVISSSTTGGGGGVDDDDDDSAEGGCKWLWR